MRIAFLSLILLFSTLIEAKSDWRIVKNQDDIKVYSRNVQNVGKTLRGSITVDGSISSVLAVIEDTDSYPRWLHNCYQAQQIKHSNANRNINYVVINLPWPVKDRDIVIEGIRTQQKHNKSVEIKFKAVR